MKPSEDLLSLAVEAKNSAIAPYSSFRVGAAVETKSGKTYHGCNIESSSYSLTCCAERLALFKALSEGEREFVRMAIAADTEEFCTPCGACRQVLWDYAPDLALLLINISGNVRQVALRELLPEAFDGRLLRTK